MIDTVVIYVGDSDTNYPMREPGNQGIITRKRGYVGNFCVHVGVPGIQKFWETLI